MGVRAVGSVVSELRDAVEDQRTIFVLGLKRSGIHLLVNWLFANLGGRRHGHLGQRNVHPQLTEGFADTSARVAFHNNVGGFHSRRFGLGHLQAQDFERAAAPNRATIFGLEDCQLDIAHSVVHGPATTRVLVLRDPLNNVASRLAAAVDRPDTFRTDGAYLDLLATYCDEFVGRSRLLDPKVVVSFNRFVADRPYRDAIARQLDVPNEDAVSEVSPYGGGSSFSQTSRSTVEELTTRFLQHPIPPELAVELSARPAIVEAARAAFEYDLSKLAQE